MPTSSPVQLRLTLPTELLNKYEAQALQSGQQLEDVIIVRLTEHQDQSSYTGRALSLSPEQRQELERALGKSIRTSSELVHSIRAALSVRINELTVQLTPELLRRLQTRCVRVPFAKFLPEVIVRQLEHFAGLR